MADSKRVYFKRRLANLKALSRKYWLGNFSLMVNDALDKVYNLDPETGLQRPGGESYVAEPPQPPWPRADLPAPKKRKKPRAR